MNQGTNRPDAGDDRTERGPFTPPPVPLPLAPNTWVAGPIPSGGRFVPGQVLFDRYLVERQIGEGGMGTVWLVRHRALSSERALKMIVAGIHMNAEARARFLREARIMAKLSHPNVVTVHDVQLTDDGAFIEMEYIKGRSLRDVLEPGRPAPCEWVANILEQLCDVLQVTHDMGVVHRDLKPSNLMLVDGRRPGRELLKVLDFGIAKNSASDFEDDGIKTQSGSFLGTAYYSSPEQVSGDPVDGRSDIYSTGILLYEMLTGHRPFVGPLRTLVYQHTTVPPPPFAESNPSVDIPREIEDVVRACLAKDPADRPRTARALADAFARAVERSATPPPPPSPPPRPKSYVKPALGVGACLLAIVAWYQFSRLKVEPGGPVVPAPIDSKPKVPKPKTPAWSLSLSLRVWERQGFEPETAAKDGDGWPGVLIRRDTNLRFVLKPGDRGIYLPVGYSASSERATDDWPRRLTRETDGEIFIRVPGGEFEMGGERDDCAGPRHRVRLSGFYVQRTEAANAELSRFHDQAGDEEKARLKECMDRIGRLRKLRRQDELKDDSLQHPAVSVDYPMAESYARWAHGQLPTEAQWEFAARSRGLAVRYPWQWRQAGEPIGVNLRPTAPETIETEPVGTFEQGDVTAEGILDLAGNVQEWCRDVWGPYPLEANASIVRDPFGLVPFPKGDDGCVTPRDDPPHRTIRGGSFSDDPDQVDVRFRLHRNPSDKRENLGFRLVIECPSPPIPSSSGAPGQSPDPPRAERGD